MESDPCVFYNKDEGSIIVVYVDDLILITRSKSDMTKLKDLIAKTYKVRDLGALSFYLGIRFTRDRAARTISMNMAAYLDRLLKEYHLTDAPTEPSPLPKTDT